MGWLRAVRASRRASHHLVQEVAVRSSNRSIAASGRLAHAGFRGDVRVCTVDAWRLGRAEAIGQDGLYGAIFTDASGLLATGFSPLLPSQPTQESTVERASDAVQPGSSG